MAEPDGNGLRKTRELQNHTLDSTIWNEVELRDGDIVIANYARAGASWIQQIVAQLIFAGDPAVSVGEISPWVEFRGRPKAEALTLLKGQTQRRIMTTHLPVDALPISPKTKYIYVGRDARDVVWSLHDQHAAASDRWCAALNDAPGLVGPPLARPDPDIRRYYRTWLAEEGRPFWPYWEALAGWWALREAPNVKLVHFNDLKGALREEIEGLAAFLDIDVAADRWPAILEHCSFDYMKANADLIGPFGEAGLINQGVNGRWRGVLSEDESTAYKEAAKVELGREGAAWLNHGWRRL
jgi:aryl sulfotransferase